MSRRIEATLIQSLNRNAILQGSYNYDLINKISYLKLIVILKELTYLEAVSYKKIAEYESMYYKEFSVLAIFYTFVLLQSE